MSQPAARHHTTKRRMLLLHHSADVGGGTTSLLDIIDTLSSEFQLTLVCPTPPAWLAARYARAGINVVPHDGPYPLFNHYNGGPSLLSRTFWSGLYASLHSKARWVEIFGDGRFDVVLLNSAVLIPLARVAQSFGIPTVCMVRETFNGSSIRTNALRSLLNRHCNAVIFLSDYDMTAARLRVPVVGVVRDVLRPKAWQKYAPATAKAALGLPQDRVYVLFLGGSARLKALDVVLRAMLHITSEAVHLLVAGDTTDLYSSLGLSSVLRPGHAVFKHRLRTALRHIPTERVHFLGTLEDPSVAYSASDIVVFSAAKPHQGRPIYEAGWYRLPVVAPDYPNLRDAMQDGRTGLTHQPRNARGLARSIDTLARDPGLRARLGGANHSHAQATRDPKSEGRELLRLIESIL